MTDVNADLVHQVAHFWPLARSTSSKYDQIANLAPPLFALQRYAGFAHPILYDADHHDENSARTLYRRRQLRQRRPVTPPAMSEFIAAGVAGAELVMIAGAAHLSNIEQPTAFNRAMRNFLDRVEGWEPGRG